MHRGAPTLTAPHLGVHGQMLMDKHGQVVIGGNVIIHAPTDPCTNTQRLCSVDTLTHQQCSGGKECGLWMVE